MSLWACFLQAQVQEAYRPKIPRCTGGKREQRLLCKAVFIEAEHSAQKGLIFNFLSVRENHLFLFIWPRTGVLLTHFDFQYSSQPNHSLANCESYPLT